MGVSRTCPSRPHLALPKTPFVTPRLTPSPRADCPRAVRTRPQVCLENKEMDLHMEQESKDLREELVKSADVLDALRERVCRVRARLRGRA